jgi:anti-sigma factor RsiW
MNHRDAWVRLDAFLDGALAAEERWAVAAHLDECAVCRAHAAGQARLRGVVRERLAAPEPPPGFETRIAAALAAEAAVPPPMAPPVSVPRPLRLATLLGPAMAALWIVVFLAVPATRSGADLTGELALAHGLFAHDESLFDVAGDAAQVTAWFRDEAGLTVFAPELDDYTLVGGRLIALDGQAVAQLVYEGEPDEVYLSLLRFRGAADLGWLARGDGFAQQQQGTTSLVTWGNGEDRVALIGTGPASELRRLAEQIALEQSAASAPAARE